MLVAKTMSGNVLNAKEREMKDDEKRLIKYLSFQSTQFVSSTNIYSQVYVALFKPLRVSRRRFKKILNCLKTVRTLKSQEIYVQEKITKVDSLSLVLKGK